jgi:hypothetical protein
MAKMFYTLEETRAALGKSEEEVKQLAKEGKLREFRDGPRLMFKADQVEAVKAEQGTDGAIELGPADSGIGMSPMDARSPSAIGSGVAGLTLSDSALQGQPPAGAPGSGSLGLKDDTALAADLGLSGSIGGMPSPGRSAIGSGMSGGAPSGTGFGSGHNSRPGVDVFQADEVDRADPMAQTAISSGPTEQMSLEGVGSGSGLLDLTRESDDTSLGAEILDDIAPSPRLRPGDTAAGRSGSGTGVAPGMSDSRGGAALVGAPMYVEKYDPMANAFGGAALGAFFVLMFAAYVLISALLDTRPALITSQLDLPFLYLAGGALVAPVIFFVIGMVLGKAGRKSTR